MTQQDQARQLGAEIKGSFDCVENIRASYIEQFKAKVDALVSLASQPTEAQAVPAEPLMREQVRQAIIDHCTALYACTRVWEAWSVGTMSEDDFVPVEQTGFPEELTEALLSVLAAPPVQQPDDVRDAP